jgi:hypothetical protein
MSPTSVVILVSFGLLWVGLLWLVWRRGEDFAGEGRRCQRLAEEEEAAFRRALVASSRKRAEFEDLLVRYREVRVAFVRHPDLRVPDSVLPAEGEAGVLAYGLDLPVPIPDLRVTLGGVRATLNFSRSPSVTFVPWEAVVGVRGHDEVASERPRLGLVP